MLPNDVKLRINVIDQLDIDFVMKENKENFSVANTIKQFRNQKNMHLIYKEDLYKDKQREIDEFFIGHLVPIMDDIDIPVLIEEHNQNIDAAVYEKNIFQDLKKPLIRNKNDRNDKTEYWPTRIKESLNWLPFLYHGVHCRHDRERCKTLP